MYTLIVIVTLLGLNPGENTPTLELNNQTISIPGFKSYNACKVEMVKFESTVKMTPNTQVKVAHCFRIR